jgi:hypothetical protein
MRQFSPKGKCIVVPRDSVSMMSTLAAPLAKVNTSSAQELSNQIHVYANRAANSQNPAELIGNLALEFQLIAAYKLYGGRKSMLDKFKEEHSYNVMIANKLGMSEDGLNHEAIGYTMTAYTALLTIKTDLDVKAEVVAGKASMNPYVIQKAEIKKLAERLHRHYDNQNARMKGVITECTNNYLKVFNGETDENRRARMEYEKRFGSTYLAYGMEVSRAICIMSYGPLAYKFENGNEFYAVLGVTNALFFRK